MGEWEDAGPVWGGVWRGEPADERTALLPSIHAEKPYVELLLDSPGFM